MRPDSPGGADGSSARQARRNLESHAPYRAAPVFISKGRLKPLERYGREIRGRILHFSKGRLERGDLLGLMSDGVLYAVQVCD